MHTFIRLPKSTLVLRITFILLFLGSFQLLSAQSPGGVSSNLQLWLKSDAGATSAQWSDQSGNGYDALQPSVGSQPSITENGVNFNPKVEFSGTEYLDFSSDLGLIGNGDFEIVTLINNYTGATGFDAIIATGTPYTSNSIQFVTNGDFPRTTYLDSNGTGNVPEQTLASNILAETPTIINETRTSTITLNVYNNGPQVATKNMGNGSFVSGNLRVGASSSTNGAFVHGFTGEINEVIVFNKSLSATERLQVQSYLALKYGITLDQTMPTDFVSSNGTTIWAASDNTGYQNDIFGIGRDDASELNQKVSSSVNNANGPILATTQHFTQANNDAVRTVSLGDGNFTVMAHDNAANTFTAGYNGGSNNRLSRIWKVDETGAVGNLYLAIPKAAYTFPTGIPAVILSDNAVFDNTDTIINLNDDGTYYSAEINPTDGQYVAFASTTPAFTLSETTLTLDENAGTDTFTVALDTEPTSDVVFDISSDDTNEATVDEAQLTFTTSDWDTPQTITVTGVDDTIDRDDSATITVTVNDAGSDNAFDGLANQTVAITLTDDDSAAYTISETALTIDENTGTNTFTVVLDTEPTSNVVFDIASDDINEATVSLAQITFTTADWDTPQTITVTGVDDAAASDDTAVISISVNAAGSDDAFDALGDGTVAITLTNDDANFTIDTIANTTVDENSPYTSETPSLSGDTPIGTLAYTLGGADAADFTINGSTGIVSMVARDFESPADSDTDNVYEVSITATDDEDNSDSEDWTVTVIDVTESVNFTIDAIADVDIDENLAYTGATPSLSGDAPIGEVTYALVDVDADDFTINTATGTVSMVAKDFENPTDSNTNSIYLASIIATDTDGNTATRSWDVTVNDVTETVNFTINAIANVNIDENTAYTGSTPSLSGDAPIGQVTYTLSDVDADDFTIDTATGVVSMVAKDFENPTDSNTNSIYLASIIATDADGNIAAQSWDVTVNNVTETVSFTIDAIDNVTIDEETPYTGPVPTINGTPVGNLTYAQGGADAAILSIDTTTGQVFMPLRSFENPDDINGDNIYEFSITATDEDGNTATEDWTVTLRNIAEVANFSINTITDADIDENSVYTAPTPVISGDAPMGDLSFTLGGADANDFTINGTTGVVFMIARDFESPADNNTNNTYELSITATDDDGNTATVSWSVTILDIDEGEPDADGDGVPDDEDAFPNDPNEDTDTDGDGTGDNADTDDDNDGIPDSEDADVDGDGVLDNGADSDGDGINDENDPVNDTADSDGDGVPDVDDAFPNDPNESVDVDGDGVGANADTDDNDANVGEELEVISAEAFTPNGDGINDAWIIKGIENYPNSTVTVYNRYGHEVFKAVGYKNDWSGRYSSKSEILPAGSYYYVIDFRNGSTPMDGWIFINY